MIDFGNGMKIKFDGIRNWIICEEKVNAKTGKKYDKEIAYFGKLKTALVMYVEKYAINQNIEPLDNAETIIRKLDELKLIVEEAINDKQGISEAD